MISIVIPAYNEEQNILELFNKIKVVMKRYKYDHEIIFVDDGSIDNTLSIMNSIKDKNVKVTSKPHTGKGQSLMQGFKMATGDIIITLDADLQDDPEEIPNFINKILDGYDLVVGWKYKRRDPIYKVLRSKLFNLLTNILTGINLHDSNCGFKAYRSQVTKSLNIDKGYYRYIPSIVHWKGYKITEIKVRHHKRLYGKSKYGFSKIFSAFFDLIKLYINKDKFQR